LRPILVNPPGTRRLTFIVQLGTFVLILGIPDGALGVLWPSLRHSFHLPLDDLGALTVAGTGLYFAGGLLAERAKRLLGSGATMGASCLVALAALVTWSLAPDWLTVLLAVATLGVARGLTDAVVNAGAALDGGVRRLGFLHASWAIGGTLGPILVAAVASGPGSWRLAVAVLAAGVVLLVPLAFADARRRTPPPGKAAEAGRGGGFGAGADHAPFGPLAEPAASAARPEAEVLPPPPRRRLVLAVSVVAFAVYVAAEAGPIAWGYTYLIVDRRLAHLAAAGAMAAFWAALTLGRFALAALGDRAPGTATLEGSCLLFVTGTALFWLLPGAFAVAGLPVAGLGSAAVFPMLVALTPVRVGTGATARAVGAFIAAAALGGPAAVALLGLAAAHFGVAVLGPCLFGLAAALYGANRALSMVARKVAAW
jgi:fucose permease